MMKGYVAFFSPMMASGAFVLVLFRLGNLFFLSLLHLNTITIPFHAWVV
jgi:hypothetical protein